MTRNNKKKNEDVWNEILNCGKILSDKEAEDMQRLATELRKESGFRPLPK